MTWAFRNPHLLWVHRRPQFGGAAGATWVARPIRSPQHEFILTPAVLRTQAQGKPRNAGSVREGPASGPASHSYPQPGKGRYMKANLKTSVLPLLTAAITCALSFTAGATDNADRHYSSNFTPVVNEVRRAVLSLPKATLAKYGSVLRTPCVTGPEFGAMG